MTLQTVEEEVIPRRVESEKIGRVPWTTHGNTPNGKTMPCKQRTHTVDSQLEVERDREEEAAKARGKKGARGPAAHKELYNGKCLLQDSCACHDS